jgi:hypothetical protein
MFWIPPDNIEDVGVVAPGEEVLLVSAGVDPNQRFNLPNCCLSSRFLVAAGSLFS